jgi:glycosyltransferase involved in cell wall biosynthesis
MADRLPSVCLTHSRSLSQSFEAMTGRRASVVPHPLYRRWVESWVEQPISSVSPSTEVKGLLLGRLSADKFSDIRSLMDAIGEQQDHLTVRALVRPAIGTLTATLPPNLEDLSGDQWIGDAELGAALRWADVLLAPYTDVTESGTIQLALSAGVRVVAFGGGAINESLTPAAIIDSGDYSALTASAVDVVRNQKDTSSWDVRERYSSSKTAWVRTLERHLHDPCIDLLD